MDWKGRRSRGRRRRKIEGLRLDTSSPGFREYFPPLRFLISLYPPLHPLHSHKKSPRLLSSLSYHPYLLHMIPSPSHLLILFFASPPSYPPCTHCKCSSHLLTSFISLLILLSLPFYRNLPFYSFCCPSIMSMGVIYPV